MNRQTHEPGPGLFSWVAGTHSPKIMETALHLEGDRAATALQSVVENGAEGAGHMKSRRVCSLSYKRPLVLGCTEQPPYQLGRLDENLSL